MPHNFSAPQSMVIPRAGHGQRLDKALEVLTPELGARARRRLWGEARILVNGRPKPRGYLVLAGDTVSLEWPTTPTAQEEGSHQPSLLPHLLSSSPSGTPSGTPRHILTQGPWCVFYKPAGLHTMAHPSGQGDSLEQRLAAHLPQDSAQPALTLCNRLDQSTSGLVVASKNEEGLELWRELENRGECEKRYVALIRGELSHALCVDNALDTDKRRISRVLPETAPPLRHTEFLPLGLADAPCLHSLADWFPPLAPLAPLAPLTEAPSETDTDEESLSFAACVIRKGARHQIRAHAAHAGYALWNDRRYSKEPWAPGEEIFVLHHGFLRLPGLVVSCLPPWLEGLPKKIHNDIKTWCEGDA